MAIPKSANERIRRKIRGKKVSPDGRDDTGRIVVKKTANNDPNRNNRNSKKRKVSEEFLRWYKGGEISDPVKFKGLVEDLIEVAVEAANEVEFPFSLHRLTELKESMPDQAPLVIVRQEMIPREVRICPVCDEEIGEKATFLPEDQRGPDVLNPEWEHRSCGGRFRYPPVDKDDIIRRLKGGRGEY